MAAWNEISIGEDGIPRCGWADSTDDYRAYHDDEWGFPVDDDFLLFEKLCLEGFQSGLSWLTILRRRDGFRRAFHDFDFKTRHALEFLKSGNKVKMTMMFRGRQITHPELGREVLMRAFGVLEEVGKMEMEPKLEGRNMTMVLAPK